MSNILPPSIAFLYSGREYRMIIQRVQAPNVQALMPISCFVENPIFEFVKSTYINLSFVAVVKGGSFACLGFTIGFDGQANEPMNVHPLCPRGIEHNLWV